LRKNPEGQQLLEAGTVLELVVSTMQRGRKRRDTVGKAARSTILQLDLSARAGGGANTRKRAALVETSANELRSWLEECTVSTKEHPHPFEGWDFRALFPGMPTDARRAAMKEAIGKARAYLTALATWQKSGKKQGRPGFPGTADHPADLTGSFFLIYWHQHRTNVLGEKHAKRSYSPSPQLFPAFT
jgi:hypothetical protein